MNYDFMFHQLIETGETICMQTLRRQTTISKILQKSNGFKIVIRQDYKAEVFNFKNAVNYSHTFNFQGYMSIYDLPDTTEVTDWNFTETVL